MARYPFPWDLFLAVSRTLPSGQRSLRADSALLVSRISPPPVVRDAHQIPPAGPLVVACNHYQRHGLWIGWPGSVVTLAVAERRGQDPPIHWLATGGLQLFQWRGSGPEIPLSAALFRRIADIYGMTALPLAGTGKRAGALRSWLRWAQRGEVIGVFPEGLAGRSEGLRPPEPGFNRMVLLLGRLPVLPVGIYEMDDILQVRFGRPLQPLPTVQGEDIMLAIASLLPADRRGAYAAKETRIGALE